MSTKICSDDTKKKSSSFLKRFFKVIIGDIRGAIVGFVIGVLLTWAFTPSKPIYWAPGMNDDLGIHLSTDLYDLAKMHENVDIEFNPPELRNLAICGFSSFAEPTYEGIVGKYFQTYSDCFEMKHKKNSNSFAVSIPPKTKKIDIETLKNGESQIFCKCLPSIVELGVEWFNSR